MRAGRDPTEPFLRALALRPQRAEAPYALAAWHEKQAQHHCPRAGEEGHRLCRNKHYALAFL